MASQGTLLSDLDTRTPVVSNDDDLVNQILADMNKPSQSNPIMNAPPPPSGNGRVINSPNPNSTYPMAMDPGTATAHMIGKDYPTSADFANLMHSPQFTHGGSQFANAMYMPPQMHKIKEKKLHINTLITGILTRNTIIETFIVFFIELII